LTDLAGLTLKLICVISIIEGSVLHTDVGIESRDIASGETSLAQIEWSIGLRCDACAIELQKTLDEVSAIQVGHHSVYGELYSCFTRLSYIC
jgi:hypothetical protein